MAYSNCFQVNPFWHLKCREAGHLRIVIPAAGPYLVVCDHCLVVNSIADTFPSKYEAADHRGAANTMDELEDEVHSAV